MARFELACALFGAVGKSGAGKTSMRSIIFANYLARDTMRLGATIDVEHSHVRFLGNLVLNLWDCGGQEAFMENYFESQRDHIFRNVQVLIYVFDIESRELPKEMEYYGSCLQAVKQNSQNAKIFCLVHKMDLIPEEQRDQVPLMRAPMRARRARCTPNLSNTHPMPLVPTRSLLHDLMLAHHIGIAPTRSRGGGQIGWLMVSVPC